MLGNHVFHFVGINIEARYHNHVFFAVDQFEPAFFIHHSHIAGGEKAPAVEHFVGFIGAVPIAFHHLRAFHPQFARFTDGHFFAFVIAEFHIGIGNRQADTTGIGFNIERINHGTRAGFGEAVGFDDGNAGDAFPFVGHGFLHGHAAAECELPGGKIGVFESIVVHEGIKECVYADKYRYFVFLHVFDHRRQIAWIGNQQIGGTQLHKNHQIYGKGEDMVERQGIHGHFAFAAEALAYPFLGLNHVGADIAVGQLCAFGHTGGAAGIL